ADPAAEVLLVHRKQAGDLRLACNVGQLRADLAGRLRAFDGVTARTCTAEERLAPDGGQWVLQLLLECNLVRRPPGEFVLWMRDDRDEHVGMPVAAVLGALALVRPGLVGLYPHRGGVPRDRVSLPADVRDPEGVDDVLRGELELHLRTDRNVERSE